MWSLLSNESKGHNVMNKAGEQQICWMLQAIFPLSGYVDGYDYLKRFCLLLTQDKKYLILESLC